MLAAAASADGGERIAVEYHFLSWRELYDRSIITADRHHSSAGEWVLQGDRHFYTVKVISRPYYALPQELCLFFDCFTETRKTNFSSNSSFVTVGPPLDDVASEFATLLCLFSREPLRPIGTRRIGDRPVAGLPPYSPALTARRSPTRPAAGLDSGELISVLKGLAEAPGKRVDAVLAAMNFYRAALSQVGLDPSGAYVSLVCAMESLAGFQYDGLKFDFDIVEKFRNVRPILEEFAKLPTGKELVYKLREQLIASERFLFQKFKLLITEFLPDSFWNTPDDLYPSNSVFPLIKREDLGWCLRRVYNARSEYVHAGIPFPRHIEFGLLETHSMDVVEAMMGIRGAGASRYFPPLSWFERMVHLVLIHYLRQSFAPELVAAEKAADAQKERLLGVIASLPESAKEDLRRLVQWTAGFLGLAVMNPLAPTREWAHDPGTVSTLLGAGLIGSEGEGAQAVSWLKNRETGETVGEFFFGADRNPFRRNEVLLPRNWVDFSPSKDDTA